MELLSWKDAVLAPIFIISILIFYNLTVKKISKELRVYFKWGVYVRIFTTIAFTLIHAFIYGGDTAMYFVRGSKWIWESTFESIGIPFNIIFNSENLRDDSVKYVNQLPWDINGIEGFVIKLSAVCDFFSFHTYIINALIFSLFCFSGTWVLFVMLQKKYPLIRKQLAFAFLFTPSVVFWSSGVLKDPVTLGALCWLLWAVINIAVEKQKMLSSIAVAVFMVWLISSLKIYILISFTPPILLWIFLENGEKIKSKALRAVLKPVLFLVGGAVALISLTQVTEGSDKYELDNLADLTQKNYTYLSGSMVSSGSVYEMELFDGSFASFLQVAPQAINVALFRPYIWEVKNPFMLLSALEALVFIYLTLKIFFQTGIWKSFGLLRSVPFIQFCFIFSLIFAFAVGTNSGNFGTLVRYKIPLMPFYLTGLFVIYSKSKKMVASR